MPSQAQQALSSLVTAAEEGGGTARMQLVLATREPSKVILSLRKSAKLLEVDSPNPLSCPRFTHIYITSRIELRRREEEVFNGFRKAFLLC